VLELLFSSAARVKVLTLLLTNPESRFYQREIEALTGLPLRAVQRELARLEALGLLKRTTEGNRTYYCVDRGFFLFPELKGLVLKTAGLGSFLREHLAIEKSISLAFIYGSYAANQETTTSDIDLLVVGEISSRELHAALRQAQGVVHREINYILYHPAEFRQKVQGGDGFLQNVLSGPKLFLRGDDNALRALAA
jgi:predicted nucleotidyltransferase